MKIRQNTQFGTGYASLLNKSATDFLNVVLLKNVLKLKGAYI